MRGSVIILHCITALIGGVGCAAAASAGEMSVAALGAGYTAHDAPLGLATELRIDLRGEVAARCRMAAAPMLGQQLDFNRQGQAQASFGLDCNAPFQLRVSAPGAASMARACNRPPSMRRPGVVGMKR